MFIFANKAIWVTSILLPWEKVGLWSDPPATPCWEKIPACSKDCSIEQQDDAGKRLTMNEIQTWQRGK